MALLKARTTLGHWMFFRLSGVDAPDSFAVAASRDRGLTFGYPLRSGAVRASDR
jgi:hypothetical protein